jgi:TatD DNase family protein
MQFIDTHTHLYDEAFLSEEDLAVERAVQAGVAKMVLPDIDSATRKQMFDLAGRHPDTLLPCLGLHPTSVNADWKCEIEKMHEYDNEPIVAIGEIGIDCYWSKEFIEQQKEAFRLQLQIAHERNLPVIIHSRESIEIILRILKECRNLDLHGVFHAYSGSRETFGEIQKLGDWYIGIGGVLTFKKASIAENVKDIPLERILLETDSPYLTPVPFRGQRNESSYIPHIAERLAQIKGMSTDEVAEITTRNAETLFKLR